MSLIVRAFPLRRPVEELEAFAAALSGERKAETADFYRKYGISHESWHRQETPAGPWVICVTAMDEAKEAPQRYAKSNAEFESWFKKQVMHLSGVNPEEQPLGPPTTEVLVWPDEQRSQ